MVYSEWPICENAAGKVLRFHRDDAPTDFVFRGRSIDAVAVIAVNNL